MDCPSHAANSVIPVGGRSVSNVRVSSRTEKYPDDYHYYWGGEAVGVAGKINKEEKLSHFVLNLT